MARKSKSVYERLTEKKQEIELLEENLVQAKAQLADLEAEKDDLEMRQTWAAIKGKGLGIEDIQKFLAKQKTA